MEGGGGGVFIVLYPELAQSTSNLVSFVLKETVFNDDRREEGVRERERHREKRIDGRGKRSNKYRSTVERAAM